MASPSSPATPSILALSQLLQESPESADLQLAAFASALCHYRRATVATPFPSQFINEKGEKDFAACLAAMQQLPSVAAMLREAQLSKLSPSSLSLLTWLLLPDTRRQNKFVQVAQQQFLQDIASRGGSASCPVFSSVNTPTQVLLRCSSSGNTTTASSSSYARPAVAYHGTSMENLHSILNTGLLNLSATRLQRNGAIFGEGIYLSTRYDVAFSFSKPADTWRHAHLGSRARCLLVCEVDMDKVADSSSLEPSMPAQQAGLPEAYLVVSRPDAIRLLYVLVYADDLGQRRRRRSLPWSALVVGVYIAALLMQWLVSNHALRASLRRWIRHWAAAPAHAPAAWERW